MTATTSQASHEVHFGHSPFTKGSRLAAIGSLLGALEELSRPADMADRHLFAWPIRRTALRAFGKKRAQPLLRCFEHPRYQVLVATRAVAALGVIAAPSRSRIRAASSCVLTALLLAKSYRGNYGSDGSDQMSMIVHTTSAVAQLPGISPAQRTALESFVTFQSVLSYFVAGSAKVLSTSWRDGSAIDGIFRTQTYGGEWLYRFVSARPWAKKTLAWSVTLAETAFPLVLVLPHGPRQCLILLAAGFHVGNARFMGLNRFFWAFLGTYPLVVSTARKIKAIDRGNKE